MSGELYTQADLDFFSANADEYCAMAGRFATALEAIRDNATGWHGDDAAKGRALAVIAKWAKEALAEQTVTTLKLEEAK